MNAPHAVPSQETMERMIAQVATANGNLEGIKGQVSSLDKRLYGNGQPGDIQRILARLEALENSRSFALGNIKGITLIVGALCGGVALLVKLLEIAHLIGTH